MSRCQITTWLVGLPRSGGPGVLQGAAGACGLAWLDLAVLGALMVAGMDCHAP